MILRGDLSSITATDFSDPMSQGSGEEATVDLVSGYRT